MGLYSLWMCLYVCLCVYVFVCVYIHTSSVLHEDTRLAVSPRTSGSSLPCFSQLRCSRGGSQLQNTESCRNCCRDSKHKHTHTHKHDTIYIFKSTKSRNKISNYDTSKSFLYVTTVAEKLNHQKLKTYYLDICWHFTSDLCYFHMFCLLVLMKPKN